MARFGARFENKEIPGKSLPEYFDGYTRIWVEAAQSVDRAAMQGLFDMIRAAAESGKRVFVAGNGGSAAIADHLCCDWTKGTHTGRERPIRTHSLTSGTPIFTALANDAGYDRVFSAQLEMYADPGDILVAISSSGESENIVNALKSARRIGMKTAAMTGFSGGKAGELADIHLHVKTENYGVVEDVHQSIMHSVAQYAAAQGVAAESQGGRLVDLRKRRAR